MARILLLSPSLQAGGAERLVAEEAKFFDRAGHDVRLVVPGYDDFPDEIGDIGHLLVEREFTSSRIQSLAIRSLVSEFEADVVFSHHFNPEVYLATRGTATAYTAHVNGSPFWFSDNPRLACHRRTSGFEAALEAVDGHSGFQSPPDLNPITRARLELSEYVTGRALRTADVVFTLTEQVADELDMLYGVRPEIVRPGVPDRWLDLDPSAPPDVYRESEHVVLSVSRLDPRKRVDLLLEAFSTVCQRRDDVSLVIVGTGSRRDPLEAKADSLGIAERVHFQGYVSEADLPSFYRFCDLFAHPAWVAYGLAPLEAYAMGAPVTLSTDTMVREVLESAPNVSIVPPDADRWATHLETSLDSEHPANDRSRLPTWESFCRSKLDILRERGVLDG